MVQQLQQLLGVGGEHVQLNVRFPLQQPEKGGGHDVLPNGQSGAKAQTAAGILLMERLPQSEIIVVHSGGGAEKEPAALGKLELLPLAAEQLGAVLLLQRTDVLGHRGLSNMELLRRPGKVHGLAYGQKRLDSKVQHSQSPLSVWSP